MRIRTLLALVAISVFAGANAHADEPPPPPPVTGGTTTADPPMVVWPTLAPPIEEPRERDREREPGLHRPVVNEGKTYARAQELDAALRDGAQDLGYTLDVADQGPKDDRARDLDMVERAARGPKDLGTWVVSARLEPLGSDSFILRIFAVAAKSKQLRLRVERVNGADIAVRGIVLLRELLTNTGPVASDPGPRPQESSSSGIMSTLRSQGRAVLASNAALFGAFTAYGIQRASGSEDPRLLYPLLTLGIGVGLGGALLVAEEWDVGTGDAWTLAGGAWWGAAAGVLIANGRHVQPVDDHYAWGVGGGLIGLSLATFALTRGKADEGDAVLVHSGAAIGLGLGAISDFFYTGDIQNRTPYTGAGYGAAIGLLATGTLATFVKVEPSRVLLVDLGAGIGAAAGAAVGSPLVFENVTAGKNRGFLAATAGGTLVGGALAWWLTRDRVVAPKPDKPQSEVRITPMGGVIGSSATKDGPVPAYGIGLNGSF